MALIVTGTLDRVAHREAGRPGNTWTELTLVLADWGQTTYLTVARDFGELPRVGDTIAVNALVRAYVKKDGNAGHGFVALSINEGATRALAPAAAPAV